MYIECGSNGKILHIFHTDKNLNKMCLKHLNDESSSQPHQERPKPPMNFAKSWLAYFQTRNSSDARRLIEHFPLAMSQHGLASEATLLF